MSESWKFEVEPADDHNQTLIGHVHPPEWTNPEPAHGYNLVVIGAGTAGLVTAAGAAGLGAKVALIERHLMGGDCLNVGCVPSKCVIRPSRLAAERAQAERYGLTPAPPDPANFPAVMERLRRIRAGISHHDSARRFSELGVDVFFGEGRFASGNTVQVGDQSLRFKKAVITTGARAAAPPIPGIEETGYLTNETIFNLTELPQHLVVIGAGPIGCEMAQAFRRLGARVTMITEAFLPREDPDASNVLAGVFREEGIEMLVARVNAAKADGNRRLLVIEEQGVERYVEASHILVGVGRAPNVDGLGLETAGVDYDARKGISVDDRLRTTNHSIFAAGDCCMGTKFTHAADAAARIVIQNALFGGRKRVSDLNIPWCTYTSPEVAHVGLYEHDAKEQGIATDVFEIAMKDVDRALADGETGGFIKVLVPKGKDRILGATIVATNAGDLISEISTAMAGKLGLGGLASVIHPYPTQAEAIKKAADAYNRTRLTPRVQSLFAKWLAWQRR